MSEDNLMLQLKELLIGEEKEEQKKFKSELQKIEETLYNYDRLKEIIDPIIEDRVEKLRKNFDREFGLQVQQKILDSEEDLIKALTPIMGKLVKKWIVHEFIGLRENVEEQINALSLKEKAVNFLNKLRGKKVDPIKIINKGKIIDVFIIQKDSGFLMGKYSNEDTMNRNTLAGMMTALKSFGQEALKVGVREEIEKISYELYTVHFCNDFDYYAAILLDDGISSLKFINDVKTCVEQFMKVHIIAQNYTDTIPDDYISDELRKFIDNNNLWSEKK